MSRSFIVSLIVLMAVLFVAIGVFLAKDDAALVPLQRAENHAAGANVATGVSIAKPLGSKKKKPDTLDAEGDDFNPYEREEIKAQIQNVADSYAESIKYPISSQPINNPDDAREYKPFEESEVDLPFPQGDGDENPIRVSAATDAFQYFEGANVLARVMISNAPQDTFINVSGVISGESGDLPVDLVFAPNGQNLTQFASNFDTKLAPANLLSPEMLLKLNVTVGDRSLSTTVAFRYAVASAQVSGVLPSRAEGPNLVVPLQLNVYQNGYYFIRAVLDDATTGQPLIQLQGEKRLTQGNGVIELNAHIAALTRQGSEGPYRLRSIVTYRGAEVGENYDAPASTTHSNFTVSGFPFTSYEDQGYIDALGQERLEFLRSLGGVDNATVEEQEQQSE